MHTTEDGVRMFATPIKELEQLRKPNAETVENKQLTTKKPPVKFDVTGQLFDIVVTLKRGTAAKAVLRFGENVATYDFAAQKLERCRLR